MASSSLRRDQLGLGTRTWGSSIPRERKSRAQMFDFTETDAHSRSLRSLNTSIIDHPFCQRCTVMPPNGIPLIRLSTPGFRGQIST